MKNDVPKKKNLVCYHAPKGTWYTVQKKNTCSLTKCKNSISLVHRHTDRHRHRHRHRHTHTHTHTQKTDTQTQTHTDTGTDTDTQAQKDTQTETMNWLHSTTNSWITNPWISSWVIKIAKCFDNGERIPRKSLPRSQLGSLQHLVPISCVA